MHRIYSLSKTGLKLLYKIRHHHGHGIHSPFVFDFINNVIEEKTSFYAYEDIKLYLENFPNSTFADNKINKLSFKIVNYFNPRQILELGSGNGLNTLYITAASSEIGCLSVEVDSKKYIESQSLYSGWDRNIIQSQDLFPKLEDKPDCIFINLRNYNIDYFTLVQYLQSVIKDESFVFIDGIRTNREQHILWKKLVKEQSVMISMDLFDVGILFFDKKYFKQNFKLSF